MQGPPHHWTVLSLSPGACHAEARNVLPQVEKTRHFLLLRERLGDNIPKSLSDSLSPSLSSGTLSTSTSISSQISSATFESAITPSESSGYDSADIESLVDREKELATKVGCCPARGEERKREKERGRDRRMRGRERERD